MKAIAVLASLLMLAVGCATAPINGALADDEAGLWMVSDKAEMQLRSSGRLVRNERLTRYIQSIACELDPAACDRIRSYVIRQPHWNASMFPNGMMQVWTGLLLRTQNEAQLAAVIGHEMVHYRKKHSLRSFRNVKSASASLVLFSAATIGLSSLVTGPLVVGSLAGFSREQERQADREGLEMMARAGYDPREASRIWKNLIEEDEAVDDDRRSLFFATHPTSKERAATLARLGESLLDERNARVVLQAERFESIVGPLRADLLEDEVALRQPEGTAVVLNKLAEVAGDAALVEFYRGEVYRLRGADGDEERALAHYRSAVAQESPLPEAHRSLGLMLRRAGDVAGARHQFSSYLQRVPDASDAAMIESYLAHLR